ncbi:N-acetyl-gamma-glutamyl-phosphate reductase, partial [bacterium]
MAEKINVGIIGVLGYAGEEIFKILSRHSRAKITYVADKFDS